jgi:L,D-transpeptidase YcbB
MTFNRAIKFFFILLTLACFLAGCKDRAFRKQLSQRVKEKIEVLNPDSAVIEGSHLYNPDLVARLYEKNWMLMSARWSSNENITQLIDFIRNVNKEGLNPEDYHLSVIDALTEKIVASDVSSIDDLAHLELLLTDAFLTLSSHLAGGKLHSETIDPQWQAAGRNFNIDWQSFVDSILKTNRIGESLHRLTPNHHEYNNLKSALEKYLEIEQNGGWNSFSTTHRKLELGVSHPDVVNLRHRISITQGEIKIDTEDSLLFDQSLHDQLVVFQVRNGLKGDGAVGKQTIEALNVPVADRIASIEANLERWRWLSEDLGQRYIMVNIANFNMQLIENGETVFVSDAIVGRPYRKTPVFSSVMTYLVLNPDWTVPPTILRNDVIPAVIKSPSYLTEKRMKVLTLDGNEVNPSSIDWKRAAQGSFPYIIRQDPGAENALGKVKFMFPNLHNVYIHDTPTRNLFSQTDRAFSSGCIRINKPVELAEILLKDNPRWTPEQIKEVLNQGKPRTVHLQRPLPVHLLYMTAWADSNGIVYFRKDVYDRDQPLLMALKEYHNPNKGL